MDSFRIATFNIRHGEGLDGIVNLPRIADEILDLNADIVGLQELDRGLIRSGFADQPQLLAQMTGLFVYFCPTVRKQDGEYGLAIAAREQLDVEFGLLPQVADEEPRGAISTVWRGIAVLMTHLSRDRTARAVQVETLANAVEGYDLPLVLLGDLNEPRRGLAALEAVGLTGPEVATFPARRPRRAADHVLVRPPLEIVEISAPPTQGSDHRPLVASVRLPD